MSASKDIANMTVEEDILRIGIQEQRLQFAAFDAATAWAIGLYLKQAAESRGVGLVVDIQLWSLPLLSFALPGATESNYDWARRKRNSVRYFHRSSYLMGRILARDDRTLQDQGDLPDRDYAVHGGGFPITLAGTGCVGAVTVSGLPQREDHSLVVEALAHVLGVGLEGLALD
jgi:uncharacterized protein (UPF0303 family)